MKNRDAELIGQRLRHFRRAINLTQKDVQQELNISGLKTYESGVHIPSYPILKKLVELYHVSFDDILGLDDRAIPTIHLKEKSASLDKQIQIMLKQWRQTGKCSLYHQGYSYISHITTDRPDRLLITVSLLDRQIKRQEIISRKGYENCTAEQVRVVIIRLKKQIRNEFEEWCLELGADN